MCLELYVWIESLRFLSWVKIESFFNKQEFLLFFGSFELNGNFWFFHIFFPNKIHLEFIIIIIIIIIYDYLIIYYLIVIIWFWQVFEIIYIIVINFDFLDYFFKVIFSWESVVQVNDYVINILDYFLLWFALD